MWEKLETKNKEQQKKHKNKTNREKGNENSLQKRKMTYKEKIEFEKLLGNIDVLEKEQKEIENYLCKTNLNVEDIKQKGIRLAQIKEELEEKTNRWLELSEI